MSMEFGERELALNQRLIGKERKEERRAR